MDGKPERLTDSDKALLALISPAQRDLLKFLREGLPWGRVEVATQNGEPTGGTIIRETVAFGR